MITYPMQKAQTLAQCPPSQADMERQREMALAWKAYRGKLPDPLKVEANQPNDNVKTNRCNPIVNKVTSFLFGQALKLSCGNQSFVEDFWGDEDVMMTRFSKMSINGATFGQVFVKLIPAPTHGNAPRIVILNPQICRIISHPDDCELHLAYIIEYPGTSDLQKKQIIARVDPNSSVEALGDNDPDDTWTVTNYVKHGQFDDRWVQVDQTDWLYPFAPVFTWQNLPNPNEPWGQPDLADDLIQLNASLNFLQSNLARIIKWHGHPKTYGVNISAAQIQVSIDDILCLPSPDSKLEVLRAMENFKGILDVLGDMRSSMDEQSRVPAVALGRLESLPRGQISGVALKLLLQPIMELTLQKQRLYGCGIRDVTRAGLVLAGKVPVEQYEKYKVDVTWPNLLPIDDLTAAQTAQILQALGVSDATLLGELGYDSDVEAQKSDEEDQKKQAKLPPALQQQQQPPGQPGQQPQQSPFIGGNQQQQGGQAA